MVEIFVASIALGLVAGLLAGLFGIGGGLIIVPVLTMLLSTQGVASHHVLLIAIATSLASIMLTAIASVRAHHRLGRVCWATVYRLSPMIMLGAGSGSLVAAQLPTQVLKHILVIFLLYVATLMALQVKPQSNAVTPAKYLDYSVALLIGALSAIVGIGGGTLTVPYLVHRQHTMHSAVAIASACGLPIAIAGTLSYALLAWHTTDLPAWNVGYVCLPAFVGIGLGSILTAPLGAKLAHYLPAQQLKRYFSVLLFIMAAKLLWH